MGCHPAGRHPIDVSGLPYDYGRFRAITMRWT